MQKPTPQLKVLIISLSVTPDFLIHLKISKILILFKLISAHKPLGIILLIFSSNPPPVIFTQAFT